MTNEELIAQACREATRCFCVDTPEQECGEHGDSYARGMAALADALEAATREPVQVDEAEMSKKLHDWVFHYSHGQITWEALMYWVIEFLGERHEPEPNDYREAKAEALAEWQDGNSMRQYSEWYTSWEDGYDDGFSRATVPDAATELTAIKARSEEVNEDEGWHIGGAWGDYGEVVVPLRILSYVVDGALDEKIVSTDPGYAATYAEQIARADRAEAERDAATELAAAEEHFHASIASHDAALTAQINEAVEWGRKRETERDAALAAIERVRTIHMPFTHPQFPGDRVYCKGCAVAGRGEKSWPCETRVALDGAPEPEPEEEMYQAGCGSWDCRAPECGRA